MKLLINYFKINIILNGGNISTEGIRNPLDWIYYGTDMSLIKDIRKKFSTNKMETYPWSNIYYHKICAWFCDPMLIV